MKGLCRYKVYFVTVADIGSLYVYLQNNVLNGNVAYRKYPNLVRVKK